MLGIGKVESLKLNGLHENTPVVKVSFSPQFIQWIALHKIVDDMLTRYIVCPMSMSMHCLGDNFVSVVCDGTV